MTVLRLASWLLPVVQAQWQAGAPGAPRVEVVLVAEAGCPFCQRAILGPLNELVQSPGVAEIINLVHHPFGNNYFVTPTCGGAPYSKDVRQCWTQMCVLVPNPPPECFGDSIVTQHGALEVQANRVEACAKRVAGTWQAYWPFLVCMERDYDQGMAAARGCATSSALDYGQLMACYGSLQGDQAMIEEAITSAKHKEVPYITVNGRPVQKEGVLAEVCAAYAGQRPSICQGVTSALAVLPSDAALGQAFSASQPSFGYGVAQPQQAGPSWWPAQWT